MSGVELGIPSPVPELVSFLTLNEGERIKLKRVPGKDRLSKAVIVSKINQDDQVLDQKEVAQQMIQETHAWLIAQDPEGEELKRLLGVNLNFLKIMSKFDPPQELF